ncbi:MAG: DUF420 domain-containing protein, partial [Acidobacteriota bacterium]|nr:DUF420 domain-containing protein [Acidobacteriota bacterium]
KSMQGIQLSDLPSLNAVLNTVSAVLLCAGYYFIKQRNIELHRACMLGAFCVSVAFLVSYLTYHYFYGSTKFTGQGGWRLLYFTILLSHTILAAVNLPMVLITLSRAWRQQFTTHRRIAKWTLPIWLYVSVTGVLVYLMLYHLG